MKPFHYLLLSLCASFATGFQPSLMAATRTSRTRQPSTSQPPHVLWVNNDSFQDWDTDYSDDDDDYDYKDYDHYDYEPLQENRQLIQTTNSFLKAMHSSFQNVEGMANYLLQENPLVAISIFVTSGLVAAYALGFVLMDGDMESLNPAANGAIPYWDEEILVMTRKIH